MFNKKDYANLTLDELLIEEKKTKQLEVFFRIVLSLLIVSILYFIVKEGFRESFSKFFILIFIGLINFKNSKDLNEIRSAIIMKRK